jgi:3-hydroxybutyryl-CoA dehydratase
MGWEARIAIGQRFRAEKTVSESDVYLYAGITGDFHPNHVNATYASGKFFGRRVVHGALLVGFVSAATSRIEGLEPPGYMAQEYQLKLVAPVYLGDTVTTEATVVEIIVERRKIMLDVRVTNQEGATVAVGRAVLKVVRSPEP